MVGIVQEHNNGGDKRMQKQQIGCMSGFLHILAGKRIHSSKRLPPSTVVGASTETLSSGDAGGLEKPQPDEMLEKNVVVVVPASPDNSKSYLGVKNKNGRQLLADHSYSSPSRRPLVVENDNQSRPPSVIARLMGLESLASHDPKAPQTVNVNTRALSRSFESKYIDDNNFQVKLPSQSQKQCVDNSIVKSIERNETSVMMNEDFEKRSKMRGMNEQFNDLNALKQILEVLQLKGVLHSTSHSNRGSFRNLVYDPNYHAEESSIHLRRWRSLASKLDGHRSINDSRGVPVKARTGSPKRIDSNLKRCNSIIKTKPLNIEIHRRANESSDSLKCSPVNSSLLKSPRNQRQNFIKNVVTYDKSPSESLLSRCDKLLHSIKQMNSTTESVPSSATVLLPSPVSVLDTGFDKDESLSPSYSIDSKVCESTTPTVDFEDDNWTPKSSPTISSEQEEFISNDSDFIYISKILHSSQYPRETSKVFLSIEKQFYDAENTSDASKRNRKLIFDVIIELLDKYIELPPWRISFECPQTSLKHIWFEFQKTREIKTNDVERKDWGDNYPIETLEAIMEIERMIFKELVYEVIRDVEFSDECMFSRTRRRLVF